MNLIANLKARHGNYSTSKFHYSKEAEAEKLILSAECRLILHQVGYHCYATGKLKGDKARERPVDVLQLPDGSLLVSDVTGNAICRITYNK